MRKLAFCLMLVGFALPAFAVERITVEQLENVLAAARTKSDAELAKQLSGYELTERLNSARLAQLRANLAGEKSQHALLALADVSAFLDLPAGDRPATATPDSATQRHIMAMTVNYLGKTLPLLPNLFAARDTMRFETRPIPVDGAGAPDNSVHETSKSRVTVLYRDGREFVDAGASKDKRPQAPDKGLTTWGEFGPILGTVVIDAAHSSLSWSHWELSAAGPEAVFHYSVPKDKSHYDVRFCCVAESYGFEISVLTERVGYHGEITVDPNTGTILRLTVLADMEAANPIGQAAIAVEYGPVEIGGKTYFCPVRGIALAKAPDLKALHRALSPPPSAGPSGPVPTLEKASLSSVSHGPRQTLLNDVAFREFHLFRGESKVLPGNATESTGRATVSAANPAAPANQPDTAKPAEDMAVDSAPAANPPAAAEISAPAAPAPEPSIPEITVASATGLPQSPAISQAGNDSAVTLRLTARLVDVPLVALDKKGRPIANLKPEDLEIYDEGQKVQLRSFAQATGTAPESSSPPAPSPSGSEPSVTQHAYSNRSVELKAAKPDQLANTIVLLIDNHVSFDDLSNVRQQMTKFLRGLHDNERVALYVMRGAGIQILHESTPDHDALVSVLAHWTPNASSIQIGQEMEARNRQTMEYVHNTDDLLNVNGNYQTDTTGNAQSLDPKLRELGDNPGADALSGLVEVARHLGSVPGHKSLVWIASDNVLADWTYGSMEINKGSRIIQSSVLRVQEAMNNAHVSVYPFDISRLEGGAIDPEIATRNVQLNPTATANQLPIACGAIGPGSPVSTEGQVGGDISTCAGDLRPGRARAQMQQDLHSIQGAYREIADATGGRPFRRASDLVAEFNSIVADGRATYLLSFSPAQASDGKYHFITIKMPGRKDVNLRYRTGFFYRQEPNSIHDRFSQAVLEPEDATEIALTADPVPGSNGHAVKLGIAATDLEIAQTDALWTDKLDVYLVQREVSGMKAHITGQTMALRLKPATYQQYLHDGIPFNQTIEVSPGIGSIRLVVVDENSGRMGSVSIPASVLTAQP